MVAFVCLWLTAAMAALVHEWKMLCVIVPTSLESAYPRRADLHHFARAFRIMTSHCDRACFEHKESDESCRDQDERSDTSSGDQHQEEVNACEAPYSSAP